MDDFSKAKELHKGFLVDRKGDGCNGSMDLIFSAVLNQTKNETLKLDLSILYLKILNLGLTHPLNSALSHRGPFANEAICDPHNPLGVHRRLEAVNRPSPRFKEFFPTNDPTAKNGIPPNQCRDLVEVCDHKQGGLLTRKVPIFRGACIDLRSFTFIRNISCMFFDSWMTRCHQETMIKRNVNHQTNIMIFL